MRINMMTRQTDHSCEIAILILEREREREGERESTHGMFARVASLRSLRAGQETFCRWCGGNSRLLLRNLRRNTNKHMHQHQHPATFTNGGVTVPCCATLCAVLCCRPMYVQPNEVSKPRFVGKYCSLIMPPCCTSTYESTYPAHSIAQRTTAAQWTVTTRRWSVERGRRTASDTADSLCGASLSDHWLSSAQLGGEAKQQRSVVAPIFPRAAAA